MTRVDRLAERELGAMETLFLLGDAEVSTRSTIVMLVRLASPPDFEDVVRAHERITRAVPHLRRRVVFPVLPVSRPYWITDPDFDVRYHVRRVRVPGAGTEQEFGELLESLGQLPLDVARPLWQCTMVDGLADGSGALLYKLHHAISDGLGVKTMWATMFTRERRPVPRELPPLPPVEDVTRLDVTRQRLGQLPWELVLGGAGALPGAVRKVFGAVRDPKGAVVTAADYVASLRRTLGSSPAERSALLARRGVRRRYLMLDLPVADLGGAAKALGESVNSVYVAAVLGGLARYHELHDAPVPELVVTMPVSVRREQDSHTENRFVGVRIAGPACGFSLAERAALVGERVRAARQEPSLEAFLAAGPVLSRLPLWLTSEVAGNAVLSDVQVSNIAGWPHAVHFGDIPVTGFYGFGPFAAAGLMVLLVTADDRAFVGVHLDADAVTDAGLLRRCLGEALAELSGLARSRTSA